ncbi:MAG: cation:proton antiporter [Syntrophorhabdus sp.]
MILAIIFFMLVFSYSIVSKLLGRSIITAPMVFTAAGMTIPFFSSISWEVDKNLKVLLFIAEMGLVLLLFTDASRIRLKDIKGLHWLPARLLTIGMLLTIILGTAGALAVFPSLSLWEAGIIAAILAPTDAGLGQVIVSNPRVPSRIRNSLNIEAGLNDGMSVPFLMFFIALAQSESAGENVLARFLIEQLGYGMAIGALIGLAGGWLLGWAHRAGCMEEPAGQIGLAALPVLSLILAKPSGASMFIIAFVAGMATQVGFKDVGEHSVEFTEEWGQLFNYFVFFFLGIMASRAWGRFSWDLILYAALSLTLIRMVPVAAALAGTRLSRATVLFMGWFGPRGLASIVLGLVYLEYEANLPGEPLIRLAVMVTVLMSVFTHGVTALPGINVYEKNVTRFAPGAAEIREV